MADGKIIKDNMRKHQKVHEVLNALVFAFRSEFKSNPDVIILARDVFYNFRDEYYSFTAYNGNDELHFNGLKVRDSAILKETEIEIY